MATDARDRAAFIHDHLVQLRRLADEEPALEFLAYLLAMAEDEAAAVVKDGDGLKSVPS